MKFARVPTCSTCEFLKYTRRGGFAPPVYLDCLVGFLLRILMQVTISGMTITRGESNSDPQFHVMVSSIQAVRHGVLERWHWKELKVVPKMIIFILTCLVVFEMTHVLNFPMGRFFTKLIPTFFFSGFNHYRPPTSCRFLACLILNSGPLEIHKAPKMVMTWKCQGRDELYGEVFRVRWLLFPASRPLNTGQFRVV